MLDLGLPDVDGLDVLRAARSRHQQVPVVVLTARGSVDDRIRGLQSGADDYVKKPFSPTEVVPRVRAVLNRAVDLAVRTGQPGFAGTSSPVTSAPSTHT
ncbi:response regulator [Kibdelosporangium lantanae]|uniref:Response regulator n=1 Tax=Kibdelosporangium lantanae TaxID=1497396 RepID=A0ABW3MF23_9PSEU